MHLKHKLLIFGSLCGLVLIVVGAVVGFKVLEDYIDDEIKENTRLAEGKEQYDRWKKLPFPMTFSVYFFNVENPDKILMGEKPKVKEVGPYVYDEHVEKENIKYDEQTGLLEYEQRAVFKYNKDLTPANVHAIQEVTILNVPLMALIQTIEDIPLIRTFVDVAYKDMFASNMAALFHKVSVQEVAFDGYKFCDPRAVYSAESKTLCAVMRILNKKSLNVNPDSRVISFSFFGSKNGATDGVWETNSGNLDIHQLGALQTWNGNKYTNLWKGDKSECNLVKGGDSVVYKPFNDKDSSYDVFSSDICRSLTLDFSEEVERKGIKGHRNTIRKDTIDESDKNDCYRIELSKNLDGEFKSLPSGFMDMYNCQDAPIIMSFPHFMWADQTYAKTVDGLSPNEDDHVSFIELEPGTGSPLRGAKRVQFNMGIRDIKSVGITNGILKGGSMLPIVWVHEGSEITDDLAEKLKEDYLNKLVLVDGVRWGLISVGIALFVGCGGFYIYSYKKSRSSV